MYSAFRETVKMLLEEYEDEVHVKIRPRNQTIFRTFVSSIVTQGRKGTETTLRNIEEDRRFKGWKARNFADEEGRKLLKSYIGHASKVNSICRESMRMANIGLKKWIESPFCPK